MELKKHVFTALEKKCFIDIIKKYSKIIENKNTDSATLRIKNQAWDKLTTEFNASPFATSQATHRQLRRLWMNLKQRQREAMRKKREHRLIIGGGPPVISYTNINDNISTATTALRAEIDTVINSNSIAATEPVVESQANIPEAPLILKKESELFNHTEVEPIFPTKLTIPNNQPSSQTRTSTNMYAGVNIKELEHQDKQKKADEKHQLEMLILREQFREAKAKADLAEIILKRNQN